MGYKLRRNDSPYDNCSKALQNPLLCAQCKGTEARSYGNFGIADEAQGGYLKTINYLGKHTQHLVIATEVGDRVGEGRTYTNLGNTYGSQGGRES
jgi:hypothetical protein